MTKTITISGIDFKAEYSKTKAMYSGGDIIGEGELFQTEDGGYSEGTHVLKNNARKTSREATISFLIELRKSMSLL